MCCPVIWLSRTPRICPLIEGKAPLSRQQVRRLLNTRAPVGSMRNYCTLGYLCALLPRHLYTVQYTVQYSYTLYSHFYSSCLYGYFNTVAFHKVTLMWSFFILYSRFFWIVINIDSTYFVTIPGWNLLHIKIYCIVYKMNNWSLEDNLTYSMTSAQCTLHTAEHPKKVNVFLFYLRKPSLHIHQRTIHKKKFQNLGFLNIGFNFLKMAKTVFDLYSRKQKLVLNFSSFLALKK